MGDSSTVIFLVQECDLRYLVENIWSGQSILSAAQELYELVLVRWLKGKQWTPWNTVLLTKDEAKGHACLANVHEVSQPLTLSRHVHNNYDLTLALGDCLPFM